MELKAKLKSLIFTSLNHFSVDGNFLIFPVLITYYREIPGLSILAIGLMPVLYNLISGFLGIYIGSYADRVDRDAAILSAGILLNGFSILVFSLPFIFKGDAYEFMILGAVILGLGQSIYHPIGATILSHTFGPKDSPSYLGINGAFGSLGRSVFAPILILLSSIVGIALGLDVLFIYFLVAALMVYVGLRFFRRKDFPFGGRKKGATASSAIKSALPPFIILYVIIVFLRSMFISASTTYVPTYLDDLFNSRQLMAAILGIAFFAPVIGQPFFGYMTSKLGGKFTISLTSVGLIVFFVLFLFSKTFLLITATFTIFAFFTYAGFPILLGYLSQTIPEEHFTRANAMVWSLGSTIGGSAGLLLFDGFLSFTNIFHSFEIILLFALASTALLVYLPGRRP